MDSEEAQVIRSLKTTSGRECTAIRVPVSSNRPLRELLMCKLSESFRTCPLQKDRDAFAPRWVIGNNLAPRIKGSADSFNMPSNVMITTTGNRSHSEESQNKIG